MTEQLPQTRMAAITPPPVEPLAQYAGFSFMRNPSTKLEDETSPRSEPPRTPKSKVLKRKYASANLGVKHERTSTTSVHPGSKYQQQFLAHPDFPLTNNIHSFAWDLRPRFVSSDPYMSHPTGSRQTISSGSPRERIRYKQAQGDSLKHDIDQTTLIARSQHLGSPSLGSRSEPDRAHERRPRVISGLSDTSTPSLSWFPDPPRFRGYPAPASSSQRTEGPVTPTTYHLRGASFEILNPRHSLGVKKIVTPGGDKGDSHLDYFMRPIMATDTMKKMRTSPVATSPFQEGTETRATPPRSLFDDLPSAYKSIRSGRSMPTVERDAANLPLPPIPLPTKSTARGMASDIDSIDNSNTPTRQPRLSGSMSVRQRLSQILRNGRGERSAWRRSQTDTALARMEPASPKSRPSAKSGPASILDKPWSFGDSAVIINDDQSEHNEATGGHYYEDSSIFGSASGRQPSDFRFPTVFSSQQEHSSRSTNASQDESTGDIIASYGTQNGDSPHSSKRPSPSRRRSMPLLQTIQDGTNSTIGLILDQYHRLDDGSDVFNEPYPTDVLRRNSMPSFASTQRPASKNPFVEVPSGNNILKAPCLIQDDGGHIRAATARALYGPRSVAPSLPLPLSPNKLAAPASNTESGSTSITPSKASYGDTRNLLMLSSTPVEIGRGFADSTAAVANDDSKHEDPSTKFKTTSDLQRDNLPVPAAEKRSSSRSMQEIIENDIQYFKRLSGLSGASQVSGSVFLVEDRSGEDKSKVQRLSGFNFEFQITKPPEIKVTQQHVPTLASTVPVAAWAQRTVEPGIMRLSPHQRQVFDAQQDSLSTSSHSSQSSMSEECGNDDHDWQTVSDSRRTLPSRSYLAGAESFNVSSYGSTSLFPTSSSRPVDDRFQYSQQASLSLSSPHPTLLPAHNSSGDPSLPHRNALTTPTPAIYTTYRHPSPLSEIHDNPFTSSPPQFTQTPTDRRRSLPQSTSDTTAPQTSYHSQMLYHNRNLSVIPEQTEHGLTLEFKFGGPKALNTIHSSSSSVVLTDEPSNHNLASEQGPTVSLEAEDGSPPKLPLGRVKSIVARLSSGADPSLLHRLREDDPRMASSPLSRSNSFAKLSHLGPKANITGTPEGTGMRAAGSSVVGTSSPLVLGSSPPNVDYMTPDTPRSVLDWNPGSSPFVDAPTSSKNGHQDHHGYYSPAQESYAQHRNNAKSREITVIPYYQQHAKQPVRAVTGQKQLMQMQLMSNEHLNVTQDSINRSSHETATTKTGTRPLLPVAHSRSQPRLLSRYRSPSSHASELRDRKRRISWICFALCALFPYLLILYGHSGLDGLMNMVSGGQIQHFGRKQKKWALFVGWSMAGATVVTLIVAFVIIRT